MRKRYRVLLLAMIVAAFIVPVGFALSLESAPVVSRPGQISLAAASTVMTATIVRVAPSHPAPPPARPVPEGAKLFAIGTVLIGVAAAVRRAV